MTSISQRILNARRQYMFDAAKRWHLLAQKRKEHLGKYQTVVSDLIESPESVANFKSRERLRAKRVASFSDQVNEGSISQADQRAGAIGSLFASTVEGLVPSSLGNAILLSNNLVLANNHLLDTPEEAKSMCVQFDAPGKGAKSKLTFTLKPQVLFISDRSLDMTLVAISPVSLENVGVESLVPNQLFEAQGKLRVGDTLNLIQRNEKRMEHYEGENICLDIQDEGGFLYSTNAQYIRPGAAIFNKHWELVAMHQCAVPLVEKGRILNDNSLNDSAHVEKGFIRVGEQATGISSILSYLKAIRMMRPEKQQILDAFLRTSIDPLTLPIPQQRMEQQQTPVHQHLDGKAVELHFHGDLNINVGNAEKGALLNSLLGSVPAPEQEEEKQHLTYDRDYASRGGYDADFLGGIIIPEPAVKSDMLSKVILDTDGEEMIFDYNHFSISMERMRKMPIWGAANVDFTLSKRGDEQFELNAIDRLTDPRMKDSEQLNNEDFQRPRYSLVQAPLFTVDQLVWGAERSVREQSYVDSMHWSNTVSIHDSLHSATESGVWNKLERHIASELKLPEPKMVVFAGPVLDDADPHCASDNGSGQIPLRSWKVIVVKSRSASGLEINTYGFLSDLSGPLMDLSVDRLETHRHKTYQAQLSDISERTGVVFPDVVLEGDVMKSLSLGRRGRVVLEKLNDVVLRKRMRSVEFKESLV